MQKFVHEKGPAGQAPIGMHQGRACWEKETMRGWPTGKAGGPDRGQWPREVGQPASPSVGVGDSDWEWSCWGEGLLANWGGASGGRAAGGWPLGPNPRSVHFAGHSGCHSDCSSLYSIPVAGFLYI